MVPMKYKYIRIQGTEGEVETAKSGLGPGFRREEHPEGSNNVWDTAYAHL